MILVLIFLGGYNITSSNFTRWVKAPFVQLNRERPTGERLSENRGKHIEENISKDSKQFKKPQGKNLENGKSLATSIFLAILVGLKFMSIMCIFIIIAYYFENFVLLKNKSINLIYYFNKIYNNINNLDTVIYIIFIVYKIQHVLQVVEKRYSQ